MRTSKYKYIDAPRPEFYDLKRDPSEKSDIHQQLSKTAGDYNKSLKKVVAETSEGAPGANVANLDSETVERLAALGYIGSAVSTKPDGNAHNLIDPKDKLAVHEAIQEAGELSNNDRMRSSWGSFGKNSEGGSRKSTSTIASCWKLCGTEAIG